MSRVLRRLLRHRGLLATLVQRELKARYRGSVLGFVWSLVNPLALILVYTFVFSTIFTPRDRLVVDFGPYGLFLATGVIPWIWLQVSWVEGSASLLANAGLIRKAAFPAELLPVVSVLSNLVHLLLALPILILAFAAMALFGVQTSFSWATASLLPLAIVVQLPGVAGVAIGLSALNVHFKDVRDLLANALTLLFFLTPILYTLRTLEPFPWVHAAVAWNPLTPFVTVYQEIVFYGRWPSPELWLLMVAVSLVLWILGTWLFERLSETLVEAV
ncbi:MAG: ABC transporter permease [Acidobacteriota bacterium]